MDSGDHPGALPDGLVCTNVPSELNTLDALNRHFRRFGEVRKLTAHPNEGKAFVQFADRNAAEAAASVPVLDRPEISLAWAQRPRRPGGGPGGGGRGGGKGRGGEGKIGQPAENCVFCSDPEEQRRLEHSRLRRGEIHDRKTKLLAGFTEQMKTIMTRMSEDGCSEQKRESLRGLALQIKGKIDAITAPARPPPTASFAPPPGSFGPPLAAPPPGDFGIVPMQAILDDGIDPSSKGPPRRQKGGPGKGDGKKGGRWTLDLRSKALRAILPDGWTLDRLREELRRAGAAEDQLQKVSFDVDAEGQSRSDAAIVQLKDRWLAEQLLAQRAELPFHIEWSEKTSSSPAGGQKGLTSPSGGPASPASVSMLSPRAEPLSPSGRREAPPPLPPAAMDAGKAGGGEADGEVGPTWGVDLSDDEVDVGG